MSRFFSGLIKEKKPSNYGGLRFNFRYSQGINLK
jgi:hypothetical protein